MRAKGRRWAPSFRLCRLFRLRRWGARSARFKTPCGRDALRAHALRAACDVVGGHPSLSPLLCVIWRPSAPVVTDGADLTRACAVPAFAGRLVFSLYCSTTTLEPLSASHGGMPDKT
jgi:hypothetical protein